MSQGNTTPDPELNKYCHCINFYNFHAYILISCAICRLLRHFPYHFFPCKSKIKLYVSGFQQIWGFWDV